MYDATRQGVPAEIPSSARSTVYVPPTEGTECVIVAEFDQFIAELPLSAESQSSFRPLFSYALEAVTVNLLPSIEYTISAFAPAAAAIIEARRKLYVFRPPPLDCVSYVLHSFFSPVLG